MASESAATKLEATFINIAGYGVITIPQSITMKTFFKPENIPLCFFPTVSECLLSYSKRSVTGYDSNM